MVVILSRCRSPHLSFSALLNCTHLRTVASTVPRLGTLYHWYLYYQFSTQWHLLETPVVVNQFKEHLSPLVTLFYVTSHYFLYESYHHLILSCLLINMPPLLEFKCGNSRNWVVLFLYLQLPEDCSQNSINILKDLEELKEKVDTAAIWKAQSLIRQFIIVFSINIPRTTISWHFFIVLSTTV